MGFPQEIRIKALVAAARHCCVCHRYKGVKVEAHHIIHGNQGGSDDYENAIALCFDCHADAGHYNPQHPRGTKFSPTELRAQREAWHEIVKTNGIRSAEDQDLLYCRYLVCQNFDAFREISNGEFGKLPFGNSVLAKNATLEFHKRIVRLQRGENEHPIEWGKTYSTMEQYWIEHPDATTDQKSRDFPYFEAKREPAPIELQGISDPITRLLLEREVPASELAQAYVYLEEGCGGDVETRTFQEVYRLRPVWATYLAITNLSGEYVTLTAIDGVHENSPQLSFRQFSRAINNEASSLRLPSSPLPPDSTVIIPLATILGPFDHFPFPEWSILRNDVAVESPEGLDYQSQALVHTSFREAVLGAHMIGPATWPSTIQFVSRGIDSIQSLYELDLSNLYTLNRYWEMGSCPHVFLRDSKTLKLSYSGELFAIAPGTLRTESLTIPNDADEMLIAELEDEETFIDEICGEQIQTLRNIRLSRGDLFSLKVKPKTTISLTGYYVPKTNYVSRANPWRRNQLIVHFLKDAANSV